MTANDTPLFGGHFLTENNIVIRPTHCGKPMDDDGDCGQGCCDDYICSVCGKTIRIEWPD